MGKGVNANIGELENEATEVFTRRLMKKLTGVMEPVSDKNGFLVRFQGGFKKVLISNQLTTMTVDRRTNTEEEDMTKIYAITDETVDLDKG